MPIKLKVKKPAEIKPIASDIYQATLKAIAEDSGDYGDYVRLDFEISDGVNKGEIRSIIASKKLTRGPKGSSKLLQIIEALTGKEYPYEDEADLESLIGLGGRIFVDPPVTKDGMVYQRVSKVMSQVK